MTTPSPVRLMTIPDLIKRLEAAEGALDNTTNEALFEIAHGRRRNISSFEQYEPSERLPDYGASIDAALTLVLEGWVLLSLGQVWAGSGTFAIGGRQAWQAKLYDGQRSALSGHGTAAVPTPAIALTIACLKARLP